MEIPREIPRLRFPAVIFLSKSPPHRVPVGQKTCCGILRKDAEARSDIELTLLAAPWPSQQMGVSENVVYP